MGGSPMIFFPKPRHGRAARATKKQSDISTRFRNFFLSTYPTFRQLPARPTVGPIWVGPKKDKKVRKGTERDGLHPQSCVASMSAGGSKPIHFPKNSGPFSLREKAGTRANYKSRRLAERSACERLSQYALTSPLPEEEAPSATSLSRNRTVIYTSAEVKSRPKNAEQRPIFRPLRNSRPGRGFGRAGLKKFSTASDESRRESGKSKMQRCDASGGSSYF